ncbi:MAG: ABC transporter permease [Candidatus Hodarchaeota archaeon]
MKGLVTACWAESLKIRRSKISLITILACLFMIMMMGLMMFISKNPDLARKFGLLGTKASLLDINADWITYFGLLNMVIAMAGLIGFAFITSWVFGREFSDHTITDLLALPVSRMSIVLSKFMVVGIWCVLLSLISIILGFLSGGIINLAGWSNEIIFQGVFTFIITSLLTILLCTPVAFLASYSRGYLAPISFVIFTVIIAQFVSILGYAPYFPWAIPALYSGAAGESVQLGAISYIIIFLTSISGLIGTIAWWNIADHT